MLCKRLSVVILLILTVFIACSKDDKDSDDKDLEDNANNSLTQTLVHDGETREYLLYVPDAYDGSEAVPLMFNFHGFSMTASAQLSSADMRSLADSENFILVYPQGALLDGFSHWNAGLESEENKSDTDDLGFASALIDELAANYNIDTERVYACGYSNGGFFSYFLACFLSDKIAAIGSVSGTMLEETFNECTPAHPTAMINIHGTADATVPYDGGFGLTPIEDVLNYWVGFNNATPTPTTNSINDGGTTIEQSIYTDGDEGVSIEHYKVIGGGHVWFDMDYEGANTNQLIWNFVSRYDVNGLRQ